MRGCTSDGCSAYAQLRDHTHPISDGIRVHGVCPLALHLVGGQVLLPGSNRILRHRGPRGRLQRTVGRHSFVLA